MALSTASLVQQATGTTTSGTTHTVTLPGGTTAGNTIVVAGAANNFVDFTAPAGWVMDVRQTNGSVVSRLVNVGAGVTSWTFTTSSAAVSAWYVAEVFGLDDDPLDAVATPSGTLASGGTLSATTPQTVGRSSMSFAFFSTALSASDTHSWAGWTNGFAEQTDIGGAGLQGMAVAVSFASDVAPYSTTATLTSTAVSTSVAAILISYREAGTPIVSPLTFMAGFDWGTNGGTGLSLTSGTLGLFGYSLGPLGTWNTNWTIATTSARNSVYGLRVVQSGVAACVRLGVPSGFFTSYTTTAGFNVRMISATGVVVVAEMVSGASRMGQLVYDASATKFGMRCGTTGTIQYQSGTTALNTWVWVDMRVRNGSTTWTADWRIETAANTYTDQTQATLSGQVAVTNSFTALGSNTVQTMTADFDDVVISQYSKPYPLGPHELKMLKVDPAGTVTLSGTTSNFQTFASNGTLTAWNATTARNNIDELPPTVSASADGLVQTTIAASDYVEIPMQTYTLGSHEAIAGVRVYASTWGTSAGGVATFGMRGWQGSIETVLKPSEAAFAPGQPTTITATTPIWRVGMWPSSGGWSQAELDAAAIRFGFSTDVAPGISAVYLEVAVARTATRALFGDIASVNVNPNIGGIVSIDVTAPASTVGDTALTYEESGSPTTVSITQGTSANEVINAVFEETTNTIALQLPPEPDPIGEP